jgi:hypothetical protein
MGPRARQGKKAPNASTAIEAKAWDDRQSRALQDCAGQIPRKEETLMMTLCIRYTLDVNKLGDFEAYAHALRQPIERCGGTRVAYYLPTKIAGPTNIALGLIDFPDLAAYQLYREKLLSDADGAECLRRAEAAGCILNEDRSFVRKASA